MEQTSTPDEIFLARMHRETTAYRSGSDTDRSAQHGGINLVERSNAWCGLPSAAAWDGQLAKMNAWQH
jgi:hypothetical protein